MVDATQTDVTLDGFLGGRLILKQPVHGYRAGVDPVLLAAATPARPGETVLDLGCGVGTGVLCLGARVAGLCLVGIERQAAYAALARENGQRNELPLDVIEADLAEPPAALRSRNFDHVIANPPFWDAARRTGARDTGREAALAQETPLNIWIATALRRLRPGGRLTMIAAPEQLPELLAPLANGAGDIVIHPLQPRTGRDASRIIVRARKGARGALRIAAPTHLHEGPVHAGDGECYTAEIRAILRNGTAFSWL